jgi:hypothetical protein
MAALHQKQGRAAIAEGLYRKAAAKCKEYVRLKKKDFRSLCIYGQTLINVAITAVAAHGHKLADGDLQRALKVKGPAQFQALHFCVLTMVQVWEKMAARLGNQFQHESAICDGLSSVLALMADAREKTDDVQGAETFMSQALQQAKKSKSAHASKSLPSLYSNLARIQLASGDTVSSSATLKVCLGHATFVCI